MTDLPTIAIVGCGAVTERYYAPALTALNGRVRIVGLHDTAPARVDAIGAHFPQASRAASFGALLDLRADLVILASPPAVHAEQAIAALQAGSHVLCEKPMALSVDEATAMTAAARQHDRLLAVNMVRRQFPASRIMEGLIRNESLGALRSVSAFEGGVFRWPIGDQAYFSHAVSGGGVLADVGTHVIDLLSFWLGDGQLVRYRDDAMGGVEANARVELNWRGVPATIRLSRDWARPNLIELVFEKGRSRWRADQVNSVEVQFNGADAPLTFKDDDASEFGFVRCFIAQIEAVLDHLAGRPARIVAGAQAVRTVALIEQAYREKQPMDMPWLEPFGKAAHG